MSDEPTIPELEALRQLLIEKRDLLIVHRRESGELVADIGHDYGLTPIEVLEIIRAHRPPTDEET